MPSAPFVRAMVVVPLTVRLGDPPPVRVTFVLVMIGLGLGLNAVYKSCTVTVSAWPAVACRAQARSAVAHDAA
jgi:hypothetical protein